MDIEVLRECYHLSQSLSFTETAKHFYIAQSALSRHISSLEHELGTTLFIRSKNGVHLAEAGHIFIADIEKILEDYEGALKNLDAYHRGIDRRVRVGYLFGACASFLAEAIVGFGNRFPSISVSSSSLEINEVIDELEDDRIDLAVTTGVWQFPGDVYNEQRLYEDGICLLLPQAHALAKEAEGRETLMLDELRGRSDILVPDVSARNRETSELAQALNLKEAGSTTELITVDANVLSLKVSLLSSGQGIVSYLHLDNIYGNERFCSIPLESNIPPFYVRAVWKKEHESKALLAFVEELAKASRGFVIGKKPVLG